MSTTKSVLRKGHWVQIPGANIEVMYRGMVSAVPNHHLYIDVKIGQEVILIIFHFHRADHGAIMIDDSGDLMELRLPNGRWKEHVCYVHDFSDQKLVLEYLHTELVPSK
jgi:hypothetical protein